MQNTKFENWKQDVEAGAEAAEILGKANEITQDQWLDVMGRPKSKPFGSCVPQESIPEE